MAQHSLSELETRALELIKKSEGILQSDLWKMLGLDSREGSRLVLRLVKKGLVRREQVTVKGRRTYKLYAIEARQRKVSLVVDLSTALEVPCLTCPWFHECGPSNFRDPRTCPILDIWLKKKVREQELRESNNVGRNSEQRATAALQ